MCTAWPKCSRLLLQKSRSPVWSRPNYCNRSDIWGRTEEPGTEEEENHRDLKQWSVKIKQRRWQQQNHVWSKKGGDNAKVKMNRWRESCEWSEAGRHLFNHGKWVQSTSHYASHWSFHSQTPTVPFRKSVGRPWPWRVFLKSQERRFNLRLRHVSKRPWAHQGERSSCPCGSECVDTKLCSLFIQWLSGMRGSKI